MAKVKLEKVENSADSSENFSVEVKLPVQLGRGPLLKCTDVRVSRKHALLDVDKNDVFLKSTHVNPTFISNDGKIERIGRDESKIVKNGDEFGFLADACWFRILLNFEEQKDVAISTANKENLSEAETTDQKSERNLPSWMNCKQKLGENLVKSRKSKDNKSESILISNPFCPENSPLRISSESPDRSPICLSPENSPIHLSSEKRLMHLSAEKIPKGQKPNKEKRMKVKKRLLLNLDSDELQNKICSHPEKSPKLLKVSSEDSPRILKLSSEDSPKDLKLISNSDESPLKLSSSPNLIQLSSESSPSLLKLTSPAKNTYEKSSKVGHQEEPSPTKQIKTPQKGLKQLTVSGVTLLVEDPNINELGPSTGQSTPRGSCKKSRPHNTEILHDISFSDSPTKSPRSLRSSPATKKTPEKATGSTCKRSKSNDSISSDTESAHHKTNNTKFSTEMSHSHFTTPPRKGHRNLEPNNSENKIMSSTSRSCKNLETSTPATTSKASKNETPKKSSKISRKRIVSPVSDSNSDSDADLMKHSTNKNFAKKSSQKSIDQSSEKSADDIQRTSLSRRKRNDYSESSDESTAPLGTIFRGSKNSAPTRKIFRGSGKRVSSCRKPIRQSCAFGESCYRTGPAHRNEEAHPGDSDFKTGSDSEPEKPECPFGITCYRKNPNHKKQYNHSRKPQPKRKSKMKARNLKEDESDYDDSFINDSSTDYEPTDNVTSSDDDVSTEVDNTQEEESERRIKEARKFTKK